MTSGVGRRKNLSDVAWLGQVQSIYFRLSQCREIFFYCVALRWFMSWSWIFFLYFDRYHLFKGNVIFFHEREIKSQTVTSRGLLWDQFEIFMDARAAYAFLYASSKDGSILLLFPSFSKISSSNIDVWRIFSHIIFNASGHGSFSTTSLNLAISLAALLAWHRTHPTVLLCTDDIHFPLRNSWNREELTLGFHRYPGRLYWKMRVQSAKC